jgi:hypothetical protein
VYLLKESVSPLSLVLIGVIVLASPLAAYDEKLKIKGFFQKHIFLVLIAMLALALVGYFTNISVEKNGYATTLLWQDFLTLIILSPTLLLVKKDDLKFDRSKLLPFFMLGITGFLYAATATLAYAHNLALSSVIVSLPLSMLFAYLLSKKYGKFLERHTGRVYVIRFAGAAIMVASAIWLSLVK